jgi:hypothetical protein
VSRELVDGARQQGLDEGQLEAAICVISMFNYFTRVADATGIEFDYPTELPAFKPDLGQVTAPRPDRPVAAEQPAGDRPRLGISHLRAAWEEWRAYQLAANGPISQREVRLLAAIAAQETTDWEGVEALGGTESQAAGDDRLVKFARKLSREPWRMAAADLASLRALGYSDDAILQVISVVAHQNADSRLALGLRATGQS